MPFTNPIVAGKKLVREAIQSPDYSKGVSGWTINRDGSAEFNAVTVRGTLIAGGTTVDSTGTHVDLTNGAWDVNASGATLSANDGSYVRMSTATGSAVTSYKPFDLTTTDVSAGSIRFIWGGSSDTYGVTIIETPTVLGKDTAKITLNAGSDFGITQPSEMHAPGGFNFTGGPLTDKSNLPLMAGQNGRELISFSAAGSFSKVVTFPVPFPTGVTPYVGANIASGGSETARWVARCISISNTNFTLFVFKTDAADANQTWSNVPVVWQASMNANGS